MGHGPRRSPNGSPATAHGSPWLPLGFQEEPPRGRTELPVGIPLRFPGFLLGTSRVPKGAQGIPRALGFCVESYFTVVDRNTKITPHETKFGRQFCRRFYHQFRRQFFGWKLGVKLKRLLGPSPPTNFVTQPTRQLCCQLCGPANQPIS